MSLRKDADYIIKESIEKVLPDVAVKRALSGKTFTSGKLYLVAVGKAAWQMARAAFDVVGEQLETGIVITKYGHVMGDIPKVLCYEAGHPVPDQNTYDATEKVLQLVQNLKKQDTVLFLLSGGGSALLEKTEIPSLELEDITKQLLACGAEITEINTIRKRLSMVKGGKFAKLCEPAKIYSIVLSDIIGDPLDMIASGPAYPDSSTCRDALAIVEKYQIGLSEDAYQMLRRETPKQVNNVETVVTGSVRELCRAAATACEDLGYVPVILTDELSCVASQAGAFLSAIARTKQHETKSLAFIAGGETLVHVTGTGLGGRNQELALAAAVGLDGLMDTAIFSVGSDGTDGPTDAAGGYVDQDTKKLLDSLGIDIAKVLRNNDAYHVLEKADGLIKTGPTGTNVNDVSVLLIRR